LYMFPNVNKLSLIPLVQLNYWFRFSHAGSHMSHISGWQSVIWIILLVHALCHVNFGWMVQSVRPGQITVA
jgi:uncharacterized membrane protein